MYKFLLTFRYLRRKLIPWFALLAVMLCTAMVIIVGSVMGGFLEMVREAGKSVMGDVVVYCGVSGFPHYEQLIEEIEKREKAGAATAVISSFALIKFPFGERSDYVNVIGIDGSQYARVTDYADTLYWDASKLSEKMGVDLDPRLFDPVREAQSLKMPPSDRLERDHDCIVLGIEVSPYNRRNLEGKYEFNVPMPLAKVLLTVLPLSRGGAVVDPKVAPFVVANEFHSGFYAVDSRRVYVSFDRLQAMMLMDEAPRVDPMDPEKIIGTVPARCTELHVVAAPGVSAEQLLPVVQRAYDTVARQHAADMPDSLEATIVTWHERQRQYIEAIEHEKGLLLVLFGIISVVAVAMITVIFYMIVLEKTRDIGILRTLGASRSGVASIFLLYGKVIGVIGSLLGSGLAALIVIYINEIHEWLGRNLDIVIWDRSVYFFDRIPSRVDIPLMVWVLVIAVAASVVGAVIPAIKAAHVDPVKSLRYE